MSCRPTGKDCKEVDDDELLEMPEHIPVSGDEPVQGDEPLPGDTPQPVGGAVLDDTPPMGDMPPPIPPEGDEPPLPQSAETSVLVSAATTSRKRKRNRSVPVPVKPATSGHNETANDGKRKRRKTQMFGDWEL